MEQTLFQWNFGPKWFRTGDSAFTLIFSGSGIPPGNSSDLNTNDSWNTVNGAFIVSP
jgi:hypothetical protein